MHVYYTCRITYCLVNYDHVTRRKAATRMTRSKRGKGS